MYWLIFPNNKCIIHINIKKSKIIFIFIFFFIIYIFFKKQSPKMVREYCFFLKNCYIYKNILNYCIMDKESK